MSEPQWANLAFDTHCHVSERINHHLHSPICAPQFCSRSNIRIVDWILRIRICNECTKTQ
jgi:hypothetical protein